MPTPEPMTPSPAVRDAAKVREALVFLLQCQPSGALTIDLLAHSLGVAKSNYPARHEFFDGIADALLGSRPAAPSGGSVAKVREAIEGAWMDPTLPDNVSAARMKLAAFDALDRLAASAPTAGTGSEGVTDEMVGRGARAVAEHALACGLPVGNLSEGEHWVRIALTAALEAR